MEEDNELIKANKSLTQLRNLSLVINLMFTPMKQLMEERNCTPDEALEKIYKAYDFTNKYATTYLKDAVTNLKPIVDKLIQQEINIT